MLLIKNGKILTMAGIEYESGYVLIENNKIVDVGKEFSANQHKITKTIDAKDLWVLPGIIEAHCHIGITEEKKDFEGNDCNEMKDPVTPYLRGLDAINPMDSAFHNAICSGITSVMTGPGSSNVVGGQFAFIKTSGRSVDKMLIKEPAAMKIAFGENPKSNYNELKQVPTSRMTIAALLREELFKAQQYLKEKKESEANGESFELNFRRECWLPVLKKEMPLKAHVHRADDILTAIRIAKEFDVNLTLDHCTEGYLIGDLIKESNFPVILGPCLTSRRKIEVQNMDFKHAGELYKKGVKLALTTDHPVTRIQYLPICAGLAVKEGLPLEEGFKAITINAAEICNVADRVGSIEVGKDADIAIFDGNPMEVFTNTIYTIIDGEIVYNKYRDEAK